MLKERPASLWNVFSRKEFIVDKGDTLADVLRVSGASIRALKALNPHRDLLHLRPGQRLRMPAETISRRTYRVRRGEDIYTLALKFDSSVVSILRVNAHLMPGEIRTGMHITLPKD